MEQALGWAAGLTLAVIFVGALGLVWLSSHDDSGDGEQELQAARKVVRCCDGRRSDCPTGVQHHHPTTIRVPPRW
jgi:hypothetical protein